MENEQKTALVTGASAGIGRAMAISLAQKGFKLILVARRIDRLNDVKAEILKINSSVKITLIDGDVNDLLTAKRIEQLSSKKVDILINNAGLALGREKVLNSDFQDIETMIATNITANFRLVHLVLPWMITHGGGDIINLCSIAGHYAYQGGAAYCATKHAVHAFTRVLREETVGKNIRVMQISPGMVNTEFSKVRFKGDQSAADSVYAGMTPLTGEDIARMMMFMLDQPRHVVIDEIITMPLDQGAPTTIHRRV